MNPAAQGGVYRSDRLEPVREAARARGLEVASIEVANSEKGELLAQIARVLGFPGWFGGNWDALEDCLCDLSWRPAQDGWLLVFHNLAPAEDFGVLVDVLAAVAEYWRDRGRPFVAVFVDPQRRLALPEYAGAT